MVFSQDVDLDEVLAFRRSMGSHMEIDSEEHKAHRDANFSTIEIHSSDNQREPVEVSDVVVMVRDVAVIRGEANLAL